MEVKKIQCAQLLDFVESKLYLELKNIPITKHRALSHIRNPRVKDEDLVLVLVFDQKEMVGYLGVFADELHFNDGVERAGWLSCMWVDPQKRGKGIAKLLINTVFDAWDHRILVTEFTPAAKGLYDRTQQFIDLDQKNGLRLYYRFNTHVVLPPKAVFWQKTKLILKLVDSALNIFTPLLKLKSVHQSPAFEYLKEPDRDCWDFILNNRSNELMNRQKQDILWMLQNPWLISSGIKDISTNRYAFSSQSENFSFICTKIFDPNMKMIGFVIMSIRDKHMRLPYVYFRDEDIDSIIAFLHHQMNGLKMDMLTLFNRKIVSRMRKLRLPVIFSKSVQRNYIISKVFENQLNEMSSFSIQDGDADAAFT